MNSWRIIKYSFPNPAMNLAMEEALLRVRLEKSKSNVLWFWVNTPSIILGCFSTFDELNLAKCKELKIPVLRRISGGGAVYHDLGNLNYTVIANSGKNGLPTDVLEVYKLISKCLIDGLNCLNVPLNFLPPNSLLLNKNKVGGMAQHLLYNITLIHGTLLVNANLNLMKELIKLKFPVANLSEAKSLSIEEVEEMLVNGFKKGLNASFNVSFFTKEELKLAKKLFEIKYSKNSVISGLTS
ncbi:MAG: biotin/lipoate A/B protein ligase family protein [Candidatus Bathyarchaeia archaeon]